MLKTMQNREQRFRTWGGQGWGKQGKFPINNWGKDQYYDIFTKILDAFCLCSKKLLEVIKK